MNDRFQIPAGHENGAFIDLTAAFQASRKREFPLLTKSIALFLSVLLALPPAALAHTCNDGSCVCGEAENGGPKGDGQGNGTEEGECSECEDEDHNQNDTDTDPVKLWRGSVYNKASQFRPIQAPGQLKTATLAFGLYYSSDMSVGGSANYAGPVGNNWTHTYDVRLVVDFHHGRCAVGGL